MTSAGRFRDLAGHDAYKILGVSTAATRKEISRARRERQRTAHPDHGGAADDTSKLINTAASVLLDDDLRREYDRWRGAVPEQPLWAATDRGPATPPPRRPPAAPPPRRPPAAPPPRRPAAAPPPRRPPAAPPDAADRPTPAPEPTPPPEPLAGLAEEERRAFAREMMLIAAVITVVLLVALALVGLLLP
jgi:hypothetical protein